MPARLTACYGNLPTGFSDLKALRTARSSSNRQPPDFLMLRSLPLYAHTGEGALACRHTLPLGLRKSFNW